MKQCLKKKKRFILPGGPRIVDTHSYKLSPFGPAEQFGGGSRVISASSFCMRLAEVPKALEIFGLDFVSFVSGFGSVELDELLVPPPFRLFPLPLEPAPADDVDILVCLCLCIEYASGNLFPPTCSLLSTIITKVQLPII